jgi:hypothetical protein
MCKTYVELRFSLNLVRSLFTFSICLLTTRISSSQHFMANFLEILDAQYMESNLLLALAVRGVGRLSPAIVKFSGKETLQQVFHRLKAFGGSTSRYG